jgi:protein-tyrosine-phosphatase
VRSVLFVCYGNIMRSAFAEAYLRHLQASGVAPAHIEVASAGVRACPLERAEPAARRVAQSLGISLDQHRATPTSADLLAAFDRIYFMDRLNQEILTGDFPHLAPKADFLSVWLDEGPLEIDDPYRRSDAEIAACFRRIQTAIHRLVASL